MFHRKPKVIRDTKNMRNLEKRRARKPESSAGTSLIMVVCVAAFLVAFALAMVYTGSMLMARANRRLEQERCYQLASSFAKVLDGELARYKGKDLTGTDPTNAPDGDYAKSFFRFACRFLEEPAYQEYSPENPKTYYYRVPDDSITDENKKKYGKVTLILYKENDQATNDMEGVLASDPAAAGGGGTVENPIETVMANISRYTLHVEVVAELDGLTYSYATSYDTQVRYTENAVEFTAGSTRIRWDDVNNKWLDYSNVVHTVPIGTSINYKINPSFSRLKNCTFTKTISEGESAGGENAGEEGGGSGS